MPITTREDLHEHLELAIKVELTTVPPYLYAMYSIEDPSSAPAVLLRSIVVEEMLHAVLAANVLLAVGGRPRFERRDYLPTYPGLVPHHIPPLEVRLEPCSTEVLRDVFARIEQPELHGAPAEPDEFETLGQFYHALEIGLAEVADADALFAEPQVDRQLADPAFYAPVEADAADSGGLMAVTDLASAREAIDIIIHQGEGLSDERWADPAHQELTHYYKLRQILDGVSPLGSVRPLPVDPRTRDYPEPIQPASELFNGAYRYMYLLLHRLMQPVPDKSATVDELYGVMTGVMTPLARFLVRQPLGAGLMAAPTFEVVDLPAHDARGYLARQAAQVATAWPELAPVAAALG